MKQIAFFLTLTLLVFNTSFGQKKFLEGFIVNNSNDTVKGLIEHQNWAQNPETIQFRNASGSGDVTYSPSDIRSFKVANETYVSGVVTIDISKDMDYSNKPENVVDTTFLLVLVNGEKSLYYLKSKMLKDYFFIKKDNRFETLFNKEYLTRIDGAIYNKKIESYKGQLNYYLQDCPKIMKNIKEVIYSRNNLIRLFEKYYACTGEKPLYQKELRKLSTEFGVLAGMSLTDLEFTTESEIYDGLVNADFSSSVNPVVGVHFNVIFSKLSLVNELMYTTYKTSGVYRDDVSEYYYGIYTNKIGYSCIKLNNLLRIRMPIDKVSFFVDAGITNGINLSSTNNRELEMHNYSYIYTIKGKAIDKDLTGEQGIIGGAGVSFKNYSLEFRYEKDRAKSPLMRLKAPIDRSMFILSYKF
jgi:hypothetical protein